MNCQTQRLLEGSLGDAPPSPIPPSKQGSPRHLPGIPAGASPKHAPGALSSGSPRHQPAPSQAASPHHQKSAPVSTASPQHQTGAASQQRGTAGHPQEPTHDKRSSQQNQLKSLEQIKNEDRKHQDDVTQPKAPADSQKLSKQMVPKGKTMGSKKESGSKNGKSSSEIQKMRDQEVGC